MFTLENYKILFLLILAILLPLGPGQYTQIRDNFRLHSRPQDHEIDEEKYLGTKLDGEYSFVIRMVMSSNSVRCR